MTVSHVEGLYCRPFYNGVIAIPMAEKLLMLERLNKAADESLARIAKQRKRDERRRRW